MFCAGHMRPPRVHAARVGLSISILAIAVVALMVNVPIPARASASVPQAVATPAAGIAAGVTWNGVNISTAPADSSALAIDFSQSANLKYSWSSPGSAPISINDARLQMFYFGFAVSTRDVTLSTAQSSDSNLPLNWTPLAIANVLEGVYRLTASLVAPNGTTMWSENFYVRGNAPLGLVAVIPIVLIVIALYEVYALVRSGRYEAIGRKAPTPPASSSPPANPPSQTSGDQPAAGAAPPSDNPPPSGGAS